MKNVNKALGATLGGAISVIGIWAIHVAFPDLVIPPEVAAAITTVVSAALVYFAPANKND